MEDRWLQRLLHRQMYIDLIRAYLADYGTQRDLARALDISSSVLNHLLTPIRAHGVDDAGPWTAAARHIRSNLRESLGLAQTPTPSRAAEIAALLCTDAERRDLLLHHMTMARRRAWSPHRENPTLPGDVLEDRLRAIGAVHETALYGRDPRQAGMAYMAVWEASAALLARMNTREHLLLRVQVLMFLNNAASVLNRADLALWHAREAELMLVTMHDELERPMADRMYMNALLAAMVTLNNLGLSAKAVEIADHAKTLPSYTLEPRAWKRSFLEQHLKALRILPRFSISEARYLAESAAACAEHDPEVTIGIDAHLAAAYLAREWELNLRRARRLVDDLRVRAAATPTLVPLRRVRLLRVAAAVYGAEGDLTERDAVLREALHIIDLAGFRHQGAELERVYGHS